MLVAKSLKGLVLVLGGGLVMRRACFRDWHRRIDLVVGGSFAVLVIGFLNGLVLYVGGCRVGGGVLDNSRWKIGRGTDGIEVHDALGEGFVEVRCTVLHGWSFE